MTADMKGQLRPTLYRFKLGDFEVMTILDSFAVRDGLGSVHAGGSKPGEIEELAKKNNIDPSKFEHPFVPVLVNTGKQVILFDTGNGTLAKDNEALKGRVPDGHLVEQDHRSEEHTSELQSQSNLVCRLLLEKKKQDTVAP